jgi:hypothetical protein
MLVQGFTPCYRLEPETVEAIHSLRCPAGVESLGWMFQWDNPFDDGRLNILHQYQTGRERFLAGEGEALLVVESDIIPPPEMLEKLAALKADCAYGVYRFRASSVVNVFERYAGQPRNEGESLSLYPHKLRQAVRAGQVACSGGGLGCVLIRRNVLESINFRLEGDTGHCDGCFNRDVMRAGFSQMADMSVVCGHKTEYGEILWPRLF